MTNYETPKEVDCFRIIASLSNLFVPGLGFAFYGDLKRFIKYLIIAIVGGVFTLGILYLVMSILATVKVWQQQ